MTEAKTLTRKDIMNVLSISSTGFTKLVGLGIIKKETTSKMYTIPWEVSKLFPTREVAAFLTKITGEFWTIDRLLYVHRDMFFDLHMDKCNSSLLRITSHDFRSLCVSEGNYGDVFDRHYQYVV